MDASQCSKVRKSDTIKYGDVKVSTGVEKPDKRAVVPDPRKKLDVKHKR